MIKQLHGNPHDHALPNEVPEGVGELWAPPDYFNDEQRAQFGPLPWFVRKILMKRVWARDFRPCLKFAHNPALAL